MDTNSSILKVPFSIIYLTFSFSIAPYYSINSSMDIKPPPTRTTKRPYNILT